MPPLHDLGLGLVSSSRTVRITLDSQVEDPTESPKTGRMTKRMNTIHINNLDEPATDLYFAYTINIVVLVSHTRLSRYMYSHLLPHLLSVIPLMRCKRQLLQSKPAKYSTSKAATCRINNPTRPSTSALADAEPTRALSADTAGSGCCSSCMSARTPASDSPERCSACLENITNFN